MRNTTKNARDKITTSRGRSDRAGWSGYRKPLFPHVLHQLLSDSSRQTIASWNEEGTAFKVHNQEAFFQHVMPEYFPQQTQYESFIRQLNLWQFRAGTEQGSYKHEFFIRGKIELCSKMVHVRNKGVKRKMPTQPEDCSHDSGVCISEQTQLAASIIASPTPLIDIDPRVIQCNNDQNNFTTTNNNNEGIHHPASIAGNTRNIHMPDERSNPPRCNEWELNQPRPNRQQRKRRCMQNSAALDAADLADGSSSPVAHHHLGKRKSETADAISQQTTMTPQNVMDDERKRNTENHQHNGNGLSFHGGSSGDNDSIRPLTPTNILQHIEPTNVAEVDQVVAENMKAPSIDDHEEDVNGVNRPDKETDPFLTEKLESVVGMEIETMEVAVEDGNEDNDVDATKEQLELEIEAVAAVAGNNIEAIAEQVDIVAAAALPKKETEFRQSQCERWNDRYAELVEFHANFHHCDVPEKHNKQLLSWVRRQRRQYKQKQEGKPSMLTEERQRKLQDLGFIWRNSHDVVWDQHFNDLIAYKAKHGHTNVPTQCADNPSLGTWVGKQRKMYRLFQKGEKSPMTIDRINRLNAIGFRWAGRSKPMMANEETFGIMDASELMGAACNASPAANSGNNSGSRDECNNGSVGALSPVLASSLPPDLTGDLLVVHDNVDVGTAALDAAATQAASAPNQGVTSNSNPNAADVDDNSNKWQLNNCDRASCTLTFPPFAAYDMIGKQNEIDDAADLADGSSSPVAHHHLGKRKSETADAISQQTTMTPQNVMDDERKRNTENHQHNGNGLSFHGGSTNDNYNIQPFTPTKIMQHIELANVARLDQVVAEKMKAPSIDDQEDVNGVTQPDEETAPFLTAKLDDMDISINLIADRDAFNMALRQSAEYVNDPKLRLMFLRTTYFNSKTAAARFVKFFQRKLDLFGERLLTKDITMADLDKDDLAFLYSGKTQLLPERDSAGRFVFCSFKLDAELFNTMAPARIYFYLVMALLEDEDVQRYGMVGVNGSDGYVKNFNHQQRMNLLKTADNTNVYPLRIGSFHIIDNTQNLVVRQIINLLRLSFSMSIRHRFRIHFGSLQECQYSLMQYGIPISALPITEDGDIVLTYHLKWLAARRELEERQSINSKCNPSQSNNNNETSSDSNSAIVMTERDVLLGRGRFCQEHPGNLRLRKKIADRFEEYERVRRKLKKQMSEQIVREIQEEGGRYIKRCPRTALWHEVEFAEAREKTAHGFRKKREMDAKKQQSSIVSSASGTKV